MGFLFRLSDTYVWMVYFSAHTIWLTINVSVSTLFVINICVDMLISNKDTEGSSRHILGTKRYNVSNCFLISSFVVELLVFPIYTS